MADDHHDHPRLETKRHRLTYWIVVAVLLLLVLVVIGYVVRGTAPGA
jgi:hypothetical protein